MKQDIYMKSIFTVIAVCLIVMTFKSMSLISVAHAMEGSAHCTGEIKANAWGGVKESMGGYDVDVTCN